MQNWGDRWRLCIVVMIVVVLDYMSASQDVDITGNAPVLEWP